MPPLLDSSSNTSKTLLAGPYPPSIQLSRQYWGTFYYQWYGDSGQGWLHWNEAGHNPSSTWGSMYLPDSGSGAFDTRNLYSGLDQSVIRRHLMLMDMARFDFALASWWGQGDHTDKAFGIAVSQLEQNSTLHLKLGVYYEKESISDPPVQQLVSDLTYIYDHYSGSKAYFRVSDAMNSYPVVFVYAGPTDVGTYATRWADARAQMYMLGKPVYIALKVFQNDQSYQSVVDGWHQYAAGVRYEVQSGYSAFASPGYWEYPELAVSRGRTNPNVPVLPRDGSAFASAIRTMASLPLSQAKFLLVETFNEFHEGSMIEPAIQVNHVETGFTQARPTYGLEFIRIVRNRGNSNQSPILQAIAPSTVNSGEPTTFTVHASDPDYDQVTINATNMPYGATFDQKVGVFSWTPVSSQALRDYAITFTATDNGYPPLTDSTIAMIHVHGVDSVPVIDAIPDQTVAAGSKLIFQLTAHDIQLPPQSLVFSLTGDYPAGMSVTPAGLFTWTPNVASGNYVVTVAVSNGILSSSTHVQIRVTSQSGGTPREQPPAQPPRNPLGATPVQSSQKATVSISTFSEILLAVAIAGSLTIVAIWVLRRQRPSS